MIYLIVPIMFVAITPSLHGGLEIFRIMILSLSPIIIYLLKPFSFKKLNLYSFLLFGILFVYFLSFIVNIISIALIIIRKEKDNHEGATTMIKF